MKFDEFVQETVQDTEVESTTTQQTDEVEKSNKETTEDKIETTTEKKETVDNDKETFDQPNDKGEKKDEKTNDEFNDDTSITKGDSNEKKEETKKADPEKIDPEKKDEDISFDSLLGIGNEDKSDTTNGKETETIFDFKSIGKKMGLEFDENETDVDEEKFVEKYNERLEKAKQEFNLDGYSDVSKKMIQFLNDNEDSDPIDFFNNKTIQDLNTFMALDPDEKYKRVRFNELSSNPPANDDREPIEIIESELETKSTREIKDWAYDVDSKLKELRSEEQKKVLGDWEANKLNKQKEMEAQKEKRLNNYIKTLNSSNELFGLSVSEKAKKVIEEDIKNGAIEKFMSSDNESSVLNAYLFNKFGEKIIDTYKKQLEKASTENYNKGIDKMKGKYQQTKPNTSFGKRNTDTKRTQNETGFGAWSEEIE